MFYDFETPAAIIDAVLEIADALLSDIKRVLRVF